MTGLGTGRLAIGIVLVTLVAALIGYVIASAVLTFRDLGLRAEIDFYYVAENYLAIRAARPPGAPHAARGGWPGHDSRMGMTIS